MKNQQMDNIGHKVETKLNSWPDLNGIKLTHFFEYSPTEAKVICKRRDECGGGSYEWPLLRQDRLKRHAIEHHGGLLEVAEKDFRFFKRMRGVQAEGVASGNSKCCWIANATNFPLMVSAFPNLGESSLEVNACLDTDPLPGGQLGVHWTKGTKYPPNLQTMAVESGMCGLLWIHGHPVESYSVRVEGKEFSNSQQLTVCPQECAVVYVQEGLLYMKKTYSKEQYDKHEMGGPIQRLYPELDPDEIKIWRWMPRAESPWFLAHPNWPITRFGERRCME